MLLFFLESYFLGPERVSFFCLYRYRYFLFQLPDKSKLLRLGIFSTMFRNISPGISMSSKRKKRKWKIKTAFIITYNETSFSDDISAIHLVYSISKAHPLEKLHFWHLISKRNLRYTFLIGWKQSYLVTCGRKCEA